MALYLWLRAWHVIFMVTWFAGLFYLPRLFVYHSMAEDAVSIERFKLMEKRLFYAITTPGGVLTTLLGTALLLQHTQTYLHQGWMHVKLFLVLLLWAFHLFCGYYVHRFSRDANQRSSLFYRWFNEFPTVILIVVVLLVELKP